MNKSGGYVISWCCVGLRCGEERDSVCCEESLFGREYCNNDNPGPRLPEQRESRVILLPETHVASKWQVAIASGQFLGYWVLDTGY